MSWFEFLWVVHAVKFFLHQIRYHSLILMQHMFCIRNKPNWHWVLIHEKHAYHHYRWKIWEQTTNAMSAIASKMLTKHGIQKLKTFNRCQVYLPFKNFCKLPFLVHARFLIWVWAWLEFKHVRLNLSIIWSNKKNCYSRLFLNPVKHARRGTYNCSFTNTVS